ncbi:MAG: histidine kinase dimerization/phosphoacceptor domain-containing protein, partial [Mobilitalea sp.]
MIDRPFLYFLTKIIATIASVIVLGSTNVDITVMVISTLSFACIFVLEILLGRVKKYNKIIMATISGCMIACFSLGLELLFPLLIVLVIHLLDLTIDSSMFYFIIIVLLALLILIFSPGIISIVLTLVLASMLMICRILLAKYNLYNEMYDTQKEVVVELNQKIADLRSLTKTLKYTTSIEERNRIAARIHDQVGHGISGSIIMLEASM